MRTNCTIGIFFELTNWRPFLSTLLQKLIKYLAKSKLDTLKSEMFFICLSKIPHYANCHQNIICRSITYMVKIHCSLKLVNDVNFIIYYKVGN